MGAEGGLTGTRTPFSLEAGLNPGLVNLVCCHPVAGKFLAKIWVHLSSPCMWPLFVTVKWLCSSQSNSTTTLEFPEGNSCEFEIVIPVYMIQIRDNVLIVFSCAVCFL